MSQKILYQGAEAILTLNEKTNEVVKERLKKSYRISELDEQIRKRRTKSEANILEKASKSINVPKVIKIDENKKEIIMEYIEGKKLSEYLDNFSIETQKKILKTIGQETAKLHNLDIIHGDLTTSNMILVEENPASQINVNNNNNNNNNKLKRGDNIINNKVGVGERLCDRQSKIITERGRELGRGNGGGIVGNQNNNLQVYFIDFGLSFHSSKVEDKAVDLHLIKQALEAKHYKNWEVLFKEFEKSYSKTTHSGKIILERLKAVEKRGRYKH